MALSQTIDSAVSEFESALSESQDQFINDIEDLEKEGLTTEEILVILSGLKMYEYWLIDLGMEEAVNRLMVSFDTLLDDAVFFGKVSEAQLVALRNMQQSSIMVYANDIGERVRLSVVQGVLQKKTPAQIKAMLKLDLSIKPYQVDTIVTTSLANYSRSLTLLQLDDKPDQKLIYSGPLDNKTRPICVRMLKEGGMTQSQIESKYPGALRDGGGFNCRHEWVPMSSNTQNKETRNKAQSEYKNLMSKRKGKVPRTLQQYYEDR